MPPPGRVYDTSPNAITTHSDTAASVALLARQFSIDEIRDAVQTALLVGEDTTPIADLWELMYILTSDDAWRGGVARYVDQFFQCSVWYVTERLLHRTQPKVYNPIDFMVHNFDRMRDPGFVRLLRVYILACPSTHGLHSVMEEVPPAFMHDQHAEHYSAIHLATVYDAVPLVVLATFLEARTNVNQPMRTGTTPIMLAASAPRLALPLQKLDLLLRYGAAIDDVNFNFNTALHHGVAAGNIDGVRLLLDARTRQINTAVCNKYEYSGGCEDSDKDDSDDGNSDDGNSERSEDSTAETFVDIVGDEINEGEINEGEINEGEINEGEINEGEINGVESSESSESSVTRPTSLTSTVQVPAGTSLWVNWSTPELTAYESRLRTNHLGRTLQGTALGPDPLGWSGPVAWAGQFSGWHSPAGVVERIENRLRCTTPMRVDLLNMRNYCGDTVLSIAASTPTMAHNARNEMVSMLLRAGADPEYETCSGMCQNSPVAIPGHQRMMRHAEEGNFLVKGIITCEEQSDNNGPPVVCVRLLKDGYTSDVCFDLESCIVFLDEDETMYPASATMSDRQLDDLFYRLSGQTFDFWIRDDVFECTFDGVDFSLFYRVTSRVYDEEFMEDILCVEILEESAITRFDDEMGRISMRFPRGPVPHAVFVNETIAEDAAYMNGFRMHKHYTLLQQAAVCESQSERVRMLTVARPLCNPLLRLRPPHLLCGHTALELLEYTTFVDGLDTVTPRTRYYTSVDTRWLKLLQKDVNDFMHVVFRDHAFAASVDINAAYHRVDATTNGRTCRPKRFTSRFNLLPDDVCKRILGFM
ncbi:hypothetical protein T484DRAFT_1753434 [Baffinella frigidus]|nr:hypothetical protein T484DRAFT_1753434 [Cryptophyta sp. CCMP2293]